jgi:hypothetical protein
MNKRFLVVILLLVVILSSCAGEESQEVLEPPTEIQPTLLDEDNPSAPAQEPYPGPIEEEQVQVQPPGKEVEPYPEPSEPQENIPEEPDIPLVVPPPQDHQYAPKPGDATLERGIVYIEHTEILLLESYPVQINLLITGTLPDPCHKLRAEAFPADDQNRIDVDLYSVFDSGEMCTQVIEPFDATIPLGAYAEGVYSIWLNGEEIGTIELP